MPLPALVIPAIGAASSIIGGYLSGRGNAPKETKMQKTQRKLVDKLLASLNGGGEYSDLYSTDKEAFNRSFVEPAQAMFRNQIAPQIQQQSIAGGQQRGTGLDDTLTRAGVDLDSMLNQYLYQSQQDALNRKQGTINSILGSGAGAPNETSGGQDLMSAAGGYLASPAFSNAVTDYFKPKGLSPANPDRKGYETS